MKRSSRIQRGLKWVGTSVVVALLIAWAVSLFVFASLASRGWQIGIAAGSVSLSWDETGKRVLPSGWEAVRVRRPWNTKLWIWKPVSYSLPLGVHRFRMPFWIPVVLVGLPTVFLWLKDRRISPYHCQRCGYNLTGNVSGICPECGKPIQDDLHVQRK